MQKKYNTFYFEKFDFDLTLKKASFYYHFDNEIFFSEHIFFHDLGIRKDLDLDIINNILFHIHIVLWISYYKFYLRKNLFIKTWKLDQYQKDFFKKFYLNWLWEFFYKNDIDPRDILFFDSVWNNVIKKNNYILKDRYLVPIWWWKDSIVSIELLKELKQDITLFTFSSKDNILYQNTEELSWCKRIFVKRQMSWNINEIIKSWAYNWHVPITWMIAFVLELVKYLYDYKYVVISNEKSADFWNAFKFWININHQYSKSFEFERDFREYVWKYISENSFYFSILRPFYEIHIAKIFAKVWKKYFSYFSSCNENFKVFSGNNQCQVWDYWCKKCPKCVFVYTILRPFLTENEIKTIFWYELIEDDSLELLFRELMWITWIKPFECVWTNEEVIFAFNMILQKRNKKLPKILEIFKNEVNLNKKDYDNLEKKLFKIYLDDTLIPKELWIKIIKLLSK